VANFATNASGAKFLAGEMTQVKESIPWVSVIWWLILQPMQVAPNF